MNKVAELVNELDAQPAVVLDPRYERLRPLTLEQLKNLPQRTMLVKGLLGAGEMSVWFGEPKSGKSFLVTHLGLAIATGQEWFGKKVKQGAVLYIVAEGRGGFAKRIEAHRKHHGGIDDAPFGPIPVSVNLLNPDADLDPLIYWIKAHGASLIVLDTLSRTMPGGNENSPEDMGAYIANCDRIREETGAHVLIIHHKPKGDKNTPRGHSSLFGAVDALILVKKGEAGNVATVEASKDEEDGWKLGFSLEVIEVGKDEDGEPITSCAVVADDDALANSRKPLTGDLRMAKEALLEVLIRIGRSVNNRQSVPDNTRCADFEAWRQEFYSRASDKPTQDAKQKAFTRNSKSLRDKGVCAFRDDLVWLVNDET
jgi:hypothetical protein